MDWSWVLIERECAGCGICGDVCPHEAVRMAREMALPEAVLGRCAGCMECVEQCPFGAIEVREGCGTAASL